jgi:hypothetical protein
MSDEQTIENQSPPVGNDDVSTSEAQVDEVQQPTDTPQQPEIDPLEEHKERSKLGRKMATVEQELSSMRQTIQQLSSMLQSRQTNALNTAADDAPPVEYITTPEDLEKYEAWKEAKMERQRSVYANNYIHTIKTLSYINPELHDDIVQELLTNVAEYPTYSRHANPADDAKRNYVIAENKLLKQRLAGDRPIVPNVRGDNSAPTGLSNTSRSNTPPKPTVQLDEYSSKFLKSLGETTESEWVQKSLSRKE